jgi:hypothetical protein
MSEKLQYVSPEYQERLENLAEHLVTARRFGRAALDDTVEIPVISEQLELDYGGAES